MNTNVIELGAIDNADPRLALAAEVASLEARSDYLHDEMESWVLKAASDEHDTDELRGLLRLAAAGEMIFDAARDMTWPVEQGVELWVHDSDRHGAGAVAVGRHEPPVDNQCRATAKCRHRTACLRTDTVARPRKAD